MDYTIDQAITFLESLGYTVVPARVDGRYFVHNAQGSSINPNPSGVSYGAVIAQARFESPVEKCALMSDGRIVHTCWRANLSH